MSKEEVKVISEKVPFITSFVRSQMSSFIATAMDFLVFITCFRIVEIYYVTSNGIGATAGAIVSFYLGRNWAFRRKDGSLTGQAIKYILTSTMSLVLNVYGIYIITEYLSITPEISKIIIALLVGVFFNFFMYRYFVYK